MVASACWRSIYPKFAELAARLAAGNIYPKFAELAARLAAGNKFLSFSLR
jgi:hypothetical protein